MVDASIELHSDSRIAHTYALPPVYLFFVQDRATLGHRVHSWLRIRSRCINQVLEPPPHAKVMMQAAEWRIALEGAYYAMVDDESTVRPQSTREDIERLPPSPRGFKRLRAEPKPIKSNRSRAVAGSKDINQVQDNGVMQRTKSTHAADRRYANRVDINVRFGVHLGFEPYTPDLVCQFGEKSITRLDADTDDKLAAMVLWELALFSFRIELLLLDRAIMAACWAEGEDARVRERAVKMIWDTGSVRPQWEWDPSQDALTSPVWGVRMVRVRAFASVLRDWPRGEDLKWLDIHETDEAAFCEFEQRVYKFYALTFFAYRSRLPTLPICQPAI